MKDVVDLQTRSTIDEEAADWLIRLNRTEEPSEDERAELQEWMSRSPVHRKELQRYAELWGSMNILTELSVPLGKPKNKFRQTSSPLSWNLFAHPALVGVTAALVVAVFVGTFFWQRPDTWLVNNGYYATAVGQQRSITLADGSIVVLNTNSQIQVGYGESYRDIRLLTGEAHFTVTKNPGIPFRVYAGGGRVEAIGTAFSVYLKEGLVDVAVTEGRVAIASVNVSDLRSSSKGRDNPTLSTSDNDAVVLGTLDAGQVVTIAEAGGDSKKEEGTLKDLHNIEMQEINRRLSWRQGFLTFSGERLEDVAKEISRYTTVNIEIASADLRAIRIGGRFPVGETQAMFDALEENFGLIVTRVDHNHVLVSTSNP